jgi:hypothetical protein
MQRYLVSLSAMLLSSSLVLGQAADKFSVATASPQASLPPATASALPENGLPAQTIAPVESFLGATPNDAGCCCSPAGGDATASGAWVSTDYLLWWMRRGPVNTPLVTAGSVNDAIPGALGQNGTRVLFGDHAFDYGAFSGLRLQGGFDLSADVGLEGSYFFLEQRSVLFHAASDPSGNLIIGRPVFNNQTGLQDVYSTSLPGVFTGSTDAATHTDLQGYELNFTGHLLRSASSRLDVLLGFRALDLNEDLGLQDQLTPLVPGGLRFLGNPINPPSTISDFDRFHATNHFYGGQLGARWQHNFGSLFVDLTGKIALGANQELVIINGASTLRTPGAASVTAPGGILAQTSNIGRDYRSEFSTVPEIGINMGWCVNEHLTATIGYTFLYWSNVVRPGNQIDPNVNPALPPTDQLFGNGLGQNRPGFSFHSSDFWAQGVNFGLLYRF